jgi:hypothetical protein
LPSRQPPKLQPGKEARQHLAGARANHQRYERFSPTSEDRDWALVALFYAALHLVQAHAITKCALTRETVPSNHNERIKYLSRHLGRIEFDYLTLEDMSKAVRYELWQPTSEEVTQYHDQEFTRIRTHLAAQNIVWNE